MGKIKELRNQNELYKRVIDEILEDCENYSGTKKEKIIARCNDILNAGCVSGVVSSMIYYSDTTKFYDDFYDEIYELIEELEKEGMEILEALKNNLDIAQIVMNDEQAKNQIAWLAYEEITRKLLYIVEELEEE